VGEYPVVSLDELLDVNAPSVTPEGFGYDPGRGELWFVGETAEAVLLELQGRRSSLRAEAAALEAQLEDATRDASEAADRARVAEAAYGQAPRLRASTLDARLHGRLVELATQLRDGISAESAASLEAPAPASTPVHDQERESLNPGAAEVSADWTKPEGAHGRRGRDRPHDAEAGDVTRRLVSRRRRAGGGGRPEEPQPR
jgi:hypothetical protein